MAKAVKRPRARHETRQEVLTSSGLCGAGDPKGAVAAAHDGPLVVSVGPDGAPVAKRSRRAATPSHAPSESSVMPPGMSKKQWKKLKKQRLKMAAKEQEKLRDSKVLPAFSRPRNPRLPTRHLFVGNTGPAVGVPAEEVLSAFGQYGVVDRVVVEHPRRPYVIVSFRDVKSAEAARAGRNRPEQAKDLTFCSPTHMPKPGEAVPLKGRWLKVDYAEHRRALDSDDELSVDGGESAGAAAETTALDMLKRGVPLAADGSKRVECPLCLGLFVQRGLRMHLAAPRTGRGHGLAGEVLANVMGRAFVAESSAAEPADDSHPNDARAVRRPNMHKSAAKSTARELKEMTAVKAGDVEALRAMLDAGWEASTFRDGNGSTPLHWAAGAGHLDMCKFLVEQGIDASAACQLGRQPIHWAARDGHLGVLHWLVDAQGASVNAVTKDGTTALHWAIWRGHLEAAKWLVEAGSDLHHCNNFSCNAFHWAALGPDDSRACAVADWLLSRSVSPTAINNQGHTPLHKAAWRGHSKLCVTLVASSNAVGPTDIRLHKDPGGFSASDLARLAGHHRLADSLLPTDTAAVAVAE